MARYAIGVPRRGYRALVALNEQRELLAACWFIRHLSYLYCPAFATRREFRGQGIGEEMMAKLKSRRADGEQVVIAAELGSVALWQRWGFRGCRKEREDEFRVRKSGLQQQYLQLGWQYFHPELQPLKF